MHAIEKGVEDEVESLERGVKNEVESIERSVGRAEKKVRESLYCIAINTHLHIYITYLLSLSTGLSFVDGGGDREC